MSGYNDFDFLVGSWNVVNKRRKLRSLIADPDHNDQAEWEEFPSTYVVEKHIDDKVLIEHYEGVYLDGQVIKGLTVRTFDAEAQEWKIIWLDNRQPPDFSPLTGRFTNGVGEFFQVISATDGRPLHVRATYDNITPNSARWRQAFSFDGVNWDTNWVMEFTRQ